MTILNVLEHWVGNSGSGNLDKYKRTYTRHFKVQSNTANEPISNVIGATGIPQVGVDVFPTDAGALAIGYSYSQDKNFFDVQITYDSEVPISQMRDPDPLLRAPVFKCDFQKFPKPMITDGLGVPILNSANQPFENPVEVDSAYCVLQVEKNFATFGIIEVSTLINSINNADVGITTPDGASFTIFKWYAKMDAISVDQAEENNTLYYKYTIRILINPDAPWFPYLVLDAGYASLSGGVLSNLTDATGAQLNKPALLNGSGGVLPLPVVPITNPEKYQSFSVYREADWSVLGL